MKLLNFATEWRQFELPPQIADILERCPGCVFPQNRQEILKLAMGGTEADTYEVTYNVPGKGTVVEATINRCKNGLAVNYLEPYMRRRDPDCMVIADDKETDKARYKDRYGTSFDALRKETFEWLAGQELSITLFTIGAFEAHSGQGAMLIAPKNAGFFVGGLADLQGMIPPQHVPANFRIRSVIYLAPPFRHTHFNGRQMVVHNRLDNVHEVFSYNLYPGPSAKKASTASC